MKKIAIMAALVFAACEFANANPKDWYSPSGPQKGSESATVTVPLTPETVKIEYKISDDGKLTPATTVDLRKQVQWEDQDAYAQTVLSSLEQALIARNEVESMAEKLDTSVITEVKEEEGVIKWYKGLTGGSGKNGNATEDGSVTITKYTGDNKYIALGEDGKTFSLFGNFENDKAYAVTADGFEEYQLYGDDKSVGKNSEKQVEVYGWSTASAAEGTLAQQLEGKTQTHDNCLVLAKSANGVAEYISIGNISGGVDVDNASTKTNDEEKIEVYGFSGASDGSIPYKGDNKVSWLAKSEGGYILTSIESGLAWSGTTAQNMYYGTSINGGLGWNMLPNVTTNSIEVDNATIKAVNQGGTTMKVVSLYTAPGSEGLYGAYMSDNHLTWALITMPTNFPTVVDNMSVNSNNTGAVQLYNWENLGNGVLCKNGDHPAITNVISKVTATNGVENIGGANDRVGLAGWTAPQCSTSLAAMLTSNATDRATHRVLCRRETANGAEMHYASIGKLGGIGGGALKFVGNYDATAVVIGSGDTTNTVTFAALDEGESPSVKVKVESDNENGVIIKLGAFYK